MSKCWKMGADRLAGHRVVEMQWLRSTIKQCKKMRYFLRYLHKEDNWGESDLRDGMMLSILV